MREFVSNHVVWAPFMILGTVERMVTIDVVGFGALTFAFVRKYW